MKLSIVDIIQHYEGWLTETTKRRIVGFALVQWALAVAGRYVTCRCCEVTHDGDAWARLDYVGQQDDFEGGTLELRNCSCGSTLSKQTKKGR